MERVDPAASRVSLYWRVFAVNAAILSVAVLLIQRAEAVEPKWTALLGVLAAGAAGALTSELACPIKAPIHIMLWHVLPVALSAGLGAVVGSLLLAWARRRRHRL